MYLMIDNQDSFVYNLVAYLHELGAEVLVQTNDRVTLRDCKEMENLEGIILSPGPGRPKNAGNSVMIFEGMKGERPMHGKLSKINHHGNGLFCNLPQSFQVTRYHSLVLCGSGKESNIQIDGWTDDQVIMAISDEKEGVYGVQFHPESVTTQYGHEMLQQFMKICENWRKNNEAISKTLSEYISVIEIFKKMKDKEQVGFLDSSLVGERGNYSILGMRPYHSIWKKMESFGLMGSSQCLISRFIFRSI